MIAGGAAASPSGRAALAVAAATAALLAPARATAVELDAAERAGKRLYLEGAVPTGRDVAARLGSGGPELTAAAVPCGSCHGADGLGRAEGATRPSPITWSELTRPTGHLHPDGRRHGPFDARTLARAIRDGVDPAGRPLGPAMPRYELDRAELAALVAYLRRLEHDVDPGVGAAELRLGTVLPTRGRAAELGAVLQRTLEQELRALSEAGGIHGRRLRLVVEGYDGSGGPAAALDAARRLMTRGRVLALVSGFFPAAEDDLFALAEERGVPVIGPLTAWGGHDGAPGTWVFHLGGGVLTQAQVLAGFAAERLGPVRTGGAFVLHAAEPRLALAARAAAERFARVGFSPVEVRPFPPGRFPAALGSEAAGAAAVLFLGADADLAVALAPLAEGASPPLVLVPGVLAARALLGAPPRLQGRAFLAYPRAPQDERPEARARLAALELPVFPNLAAPVSADAAVAVLAEGLRRAGRAVSRQALVTALEGLWQFEPGLVPPVTYGPRRRVGALGAHVLAVDLEAGRFEPVGWRAAGEDGR